MHFTVSTPHSLMCTIWSNAEDWRTIDHTKYTFSCNGGPVYSCEDMLQLGTYSALIGESAFYSSSSTSMHPPLLHFAAAFQYECLHILSMLSSLTLTLLPYLSVFLFVPHAHQGKRTAFAAWPKLLCFIQLSYFLGSSTTTHSPSHLHLSLLS